MVWCRVVDLVQRVEPVQVALLGVRDYGRAGFSKGEISGAGVAGVAVVLPDHS